MFAIARSDSDRRVVSGVAAVVLATVLISTLYVGREVFVPIALAILLSFVLAPLVRGLERWHIPRPIAVVGVVLLAFASIFLIGGMIAAQVTQLAGDLPPTSSPCVRRSDRCAVRRQRAELSSEPPTSFRILAKSLSDRRT